MRGRIMLSDDEFLRLPEIPGKRELLDGELIDSPPAKVYHSVIAKKLVHLLAPFSMSLASGSRWHIGFATAAG